MSYLLTPTPFSILCPNTLQARFIIKDLLLISVKKRQGKTKISKQGEVAKFSLSWTPCFLAPDNINGYKDSCLLLLASSFKGRAHQPAKLGWSLLH